MLLSKTFRSSTLRLALIYVALFGAAIFLLFGYVYWSTASYLRGRWDHAIAAERAVLVQAFESAGAYGVKVMTEHHIAEQRFEDTVYLLADAEFKPIAGNLPRWPAALRQREGWGNFNAEESKGDAAQTPLLRATYATLPDGSHLLVGHDIDDLDQFAETIRTALAGGATLIFALAGAAGVSITRRTVGRIEAINTISRAIMNRGLGERIPLRGTEDEWDHLAENLNSMLDRIEELVLGIQQVSDNIAHDLRTPLMRMRGRLEKAYRSRIGPDQALIGDTLAELDGVLSTFSALLRISQVEARHRRAAFHLVDLSQIATEVTELFDAAAEQRGAHLELAGDTHAFVTGDRDLLFDAIANLVDNALKHGDGRTEVTVRATGDGDGPTISIADHGPGIPAEERKHVFKRFYRIQRSRSSPGNGLGLSLVAAVAHLHGARIAMADNSPGLTIQLSFPSPAQFALELSGGRTRSAGSVRAAIVGPQSRSAVEI